MSDSEDGVLDYEEAALEVELGFVCDDPVSINATPLHCEPDWTKWDGGQVGGRPSWLIPSTSCIPSTEHLQCDECKCPLSFLLQIYCPLDEEEDAFHRSLYVFVCRATGCSRQGDGKTFRLQLPKDNAFYAAESGATELKATKMDLCTLCGQRATFTCSACHVAQYCCKAHQKDHWTAGHKQNCPQCLETHMLVESDEAREKMITKGSKWVFPEQDLEIDHEPDSREAVNEYEAKLMAEFEKKQDLEIDHEPDSREAVNEYEAKLMAEFEKNKDQKEGEDEEEMDMDVTQRELNEALGHTKDQDPQYVRFLTRVTLAKDQVLRYSRWENEAVLWVHSESMHTGDVPPCERCGGERKFEFQVLPQLLNYLGVDQQGSLGDITSRSCEWGTLAVYTCTKSCPLETQCAQEFLHYQPAYAGIT
ncbi:Programmed cell death protein 2 [Phytophthora megakarya]|uniref:Programmed cell death protein 2 n=1 Tax=Phytophthora megakarya TaxID=4795 RepID=A0A225WWU3_9STRA|nr:Programmed cell death protein 2 [Phytophthora megakarya]